MWTATFTQKQTHILLVEDDDVDAEAIVRAFRKQQITNPFTIVKNGVEALELLRGQGIEQLQRP
ncbi:MAG: hypothetical protein R2867_42310, partial [Caldilineaceae bacterium]